jgi:hypothetical protein
MDRKRSRRPPPRLLLLTGLGIGAGIGLALAAGSPAHASDQPTPGHPVVGVVHAVTDAPTRILEPAARPADRPRPVRDLAAHTRSAVDRTVADTSRAVTHITDRADQATEPVPVVGRAVNTITDITDRVVGATSAAVHPHPAHTDAAPSDVGHKPTDVTPAAGIPQTAPELTPPGLPKLGGVSSGAPAIQHPVAARQRRDPQPHTQAAAAHAAVRLPVTTPAEPQAGHGCANTDRHAASIRTGDACTIGVNPTGSTRWQQAVTDYAGHHSGRTQPPSPPPG